MTTSEAREPPRNWRRRRLRFDARVNPVKSELNLPWDTEVSFVPMEAVGELGCLRLDQTRSLGDVYTGYTYFADGDLCIAKITPCFENGKGALAANLTNGIAFGTTELHVVRANETLDARFLFYISVAQDFRRFGESEMLGAGGQKRVPEAFIKNWRAPLPDIDTQKRIAAFLDEKTAQIDALIAKKQALLERLAEKRQAIITQAVTRGLNPDTPMKDSGIAWLGQIPAHWEVRSLRYAVKNLNHMRVPIAAELRKGIERLYPYYGASGVIDHVDEYIFDFPTVLVAEDGANLLSRSSPLAFSADGQYWVNNHAHILRPTDLTIWFCAALLALYPLDPHISGSAQPKLTKDNLMSLPVWVPPANEQAEIERATQLKIISLIPLVEKCASSIERLSEYRSALITAAVTGQIEGLR